MKIVFIMLFYAATAVAVEYKPYKEEDLPDPAYQVVLDQAGNWLELTADEWIDVVQTKAGKQKFKYTQGYNYKKQQGFLKTFDFAGNLVSEQYSAELGGLLTREEMVIAYELFKNHQITKPILQQEKEPIELHGGFTFAEPGIGQPCSVGMRCVHVFANTDTKSIVLHSIVRLTDRTVPYPTYNHHLKTKQKMKEVIQ